MFTDRSDSRIDSRIAYLGCGLVSINLPAMHFSRCQPHLQLARENGREMTIVVL